MGAITFSESHSTGEGDRPQVINLVDEKQFLALTIKIARALIEVCR